MGNYFTGAQPTWEQENTRNTRLPLPQATCPSVRGKNRGALKFMAWSTGSLRD